MASKSKEQVYYISRGGSVMAGTSDIGYAGNVSQLDRQLINTSYAIDNTTSLIDGFNWESWKIELKSNPMYQVAMFLNHNDIFIHSAIGLPCNALSFLVLRRIKPLTSATLIMLLLSVLDSLRLFAVVLDTVLRGFYTHIAYTHIGCAMLMTAEYLLQYMPIWLVVLLTLERCVAVCFPMNAAQVCTISNARRSIVVLVIFDVIICAVHPFVFEEKRFGAGVACLIKTRYEIFFFAYLIVVDGIFFVIIPLVLLCIANIAIIITLKSSRNETIVSSATDDTSRQNKSITSMLLTVSIATILFLAPNLVLIFMDGATWMASVDVSPNIYARRTLAFWIIMFLAYTNNTVNFFLYVLSGRRFRTELYNMIISWFGRHKPIDSHLI